MATHDSQLDQTLNMLKNPSCSEKYPVKCDQVLKQAHRKAKIPIKPTVVHGKRGSVWV